MAGQLLALFPLNTVLFPGMPLRKAGDLTRFWESAEFIRRSMRRCNQFCGISHSVRRESSTIASRSPRSSGSSASRAPGSSSRATTSSAASAPGAWGPSTAPSTP